MKDDERWHRFMDLHIAGVHHHTFKGRLAQLAYGTMLTPLHEPDNPHDPNAVSMWRVSDGEGAEKVGYVPKDYSHTISTLLKLGYPLIARVDVVDAKQNLALVEIGIRRWGDTP